MPETAISARLFFLMPNFQQKDPPNPPTRRVFQLPKNEAQFFFYCICHTTCLQPTYSTFTYPMVTACSYGSTCTIRAIDLEKSTIVWSGTLFANGWYGRNDKKDGLYDQLSKRLMESGLIPKKM